MSEASDSFILELERELALGQSFSPNDECSSPRILNMVLQVQDGNYADVLSSDIAMRVFGGVSNGPFEGSVHQEVRERILNSGEKTLEFCTELELIGVAALNLFLQANYTGPSPDDRTKQQIEAVDPHPCFHQKLQKYDKSVDATPQETSMYHNNVLSELAADGEWPVQVCEYPYFLLLARSILVTIGSPESKCWSSDAPGFTPQWLKMYSESLYGSKLWCARAVVAHARLMQAKEKPPILWSEAEAYFDTCVKLLSDMHDESVLCLSAESTLMIEKGLSEHHFGKNDMGLTSFLKAKELAKLRVESTGALGKRTKYQSRSIAQYVIRAESEMKHTSPSIAREKELKDMSVGHSEDEILLEKIDFVDKDKNTVEQLSVVDQAILLALSLDVKNKNPADGLSAEEMGAYIALVLEHHDNWMVYSTGLLERSWLEFERSHARERSILQMQALADQHTSRLTVTQSTRRSLEEAATVQERLRFIHIIVYPPRWHVKQDLADRYASLGIVTSAAELYVEIEFWSEAVECYRRSGKVSVAENIVRERLSVCETPRMWEALGDLTNDPAHFQKAIDISNGRYSSAFIALGSYHFDAGNLQDAYKNYYEAVRLRPLNPVAWFRLGTISMQLEDWQMALRAFSQVVQQEPEESNAWNNVAAIHMRNRNSASAYPALVEALRYDRSNWRIWTSKLYTCLDLQKYDEAIQACNMLLDLKSKSTESTAGPVVEKRCVQGILAGALRNQRDNKVNGACLDSSQRTISRVKDLLQRICTSSDAGPWVFEALALLQQETGQTQDILENMMKEYRSIQTTGNWEKNDESLSNICDVLSRIVQWHQENEDNPDSLKKTRFLIRSVMKKISHSGADPPSALRNLSALVDEKLDQANASLSMIPE